jgi:hypothetical protein
MMAKYTHTPIEFFTKLYWREGLAYFLDIVQLAQEEKDQLDSSSAPAQFDPTALAQRFQGI